MRHYSISKLERNIQVRIKPNDEENSFTEPEKEGQFQSGNIMNTLEVHVKMEEVLEHGNSFKRSNLPHHEVEEQDDFKESVGVYSTYLFIFTHSPQV